MQGFKRFLARMGDKTGVLGTLVSAMGCAAAFRRLPAWGLLQV